MKFLRRLFGPMGDTNYRAAKRLERLAGTMDADLHFSVIHETRPYVIAMREVAADQFRSC
jgi:hypothetical protein